MITQALNGILSRLAGSESVMAIENLCTLLEDGKISQDTSLADASYLLGDTPINLPLLSDFLRIWKLHTEITPLAITLSLRCGQGVKKHLLQTVPQLEFTWTGPFTPNNQKIRTTLAVIMEMLARASQSIILTGYSITSGNPATIDIFRTLGNKQRAGCQVILILNDNQENIDHFRQLWPPGPSPDVFIWKPVDGNIGSLHAKMLVVDDRDLLITSANLSFSGLEANMETGVRIIGEQSALMSAHIRSLIQAGILLRL